MIASPANANSIFPSLFSNDNITFFLACIGSLGTIAGWGYAYITTRKNFNVRVIAYQSKQNLALFYLSFENKSRLPISITALSVHIDGVYYPCKYIPQKVTSSQHTVNGKVVNFQDYFSIQFPIELGSLGSTSGYVLFVLPKGVRIPDAKTLTFLISSNRGKAIEKKLSLDQILDSLL